MFRPTHFVILFAVFLCAYAAPAPPTTPEVEAPTKVAEVSSAVVEGENQPGKGDLETDATGYLRFSYGPRWGYNYPVWGARSYGWGFRKSIGWGPYGIWY